jgi:hypothetical protein
MEHRLPGGPGLSVPALSLDEVSAPPMKYPCWHQQASIAERVPLAAGRRPVLRA